jgi:hypothetical protein
MRFAPLLGGLVLWSLFVAPALSADTPPDVRTVVVARALVWCGPTNSTESGYPTNELRQGDRVQVVEELPSGWLAIRPPARSFSWINSRFVKSITPTYANNYVVTHEDYPVPVLIGSSVKTERPTKIGVKLPRGAQVRVIGRTMSDEEGTWLPIEPPENEVRYIRKEDVSNPGGPTRTTAASSGSAAATPAAPLPPPDGDALWRDAEKAQRTGRIADAIRLYRLAGDANLAVNRARADEAYQRAQWLQQANSSTNPPSGSYFYPDREGRATPVPNNPVGTNAVRLIGTNPSTANGQLVSTQAACPPWGMQPASGQGPSVTGRLTRGYRLRPNQRSYVLETPGNSPVMYVIAGPGLDLTSFENRNVELWGTTTYEKEVRATVLIATQVREIP